MLRMPDKIYWEEKPITVMYNIDDLAELDKSVVGFFQEC